MPPTHVTVLEPLRVRHEVHRLMTEQVFEAYSLSMVPWKLFVRFPDGSEWKNEGWGWQVVKAP